MRVAIALFCLLPVVVLSGCNRGPEIIPITTAKVTGTATYEGKPLEDYRVFFYQPGHAAQEPSSGLIGPDGKFTLSVRQKEDGAMVGSNQVWFKYSPAIPEEVLANDTPYTAPPPKIELPEEYTKAETSGLVVEVPDEGLSDLKLELP